MATNAPAFERVKRFYKIADVAADGDGFAVRLDGRTPKSPKGSRLILPTVALADLVAGEWAAQGEDIIMPEMPATRLAYTALDAFPIGRAAAAAEIAEYAGSDLICYFAHAPRELVARQRAEWSPLLAWADHDLGLIFTTGQGIVHQPQPPSTLARVEALALALDDFPLAGLAFGAPLLGSAILALGLQRGHIDGPRAFHLSRLDETFQESQWGVDAEAAARAARLQAETLMLGRWFEALR